MRIHAVLEKPDDAPHWAWGGAWIDKREAGLDGVRWAAERLWPGMDAARAALVHFPADRDWLAVPANTPGCIGAHPRFRWIGPFPRPLMTTTGYAMNWYPEHNLVVYVNDWEGADG